MGYRALEAMRKRNRERCQADGPRTPKPAEYSRLSDGTSVPVGSLEKEATAFLRDFCEDLGFDREGSRGRLEDLDGASAGRGQIPYNMEKDINRLCLETAIHRFMESGIAEDAFDVYFCYLEMFIGPYGQSRKMIEMLAEFEANAGSLLMKHRDHYSHSVYAFLIGLAVYHSNPGFRERYQDFYRLKGEEAAYHFLKYWGLTALFHDIGYPLELPAEQVKAYFGKEESAAPYVAYSNIGPYIDLKERGLAPGFWQTMFQGETDFAPKDINEVLAYHLARRLEKNYGDFDDYINYKKAHPGAAYCEYLAGEILENKPSHPEKFNNFMDHAYFSAVILFKQLLEVMGPEAVAECGESYLDVLTAILLHNSLYKFSVTNYRSGYNKGRQFDASLHPLAFLLMLSDELQCWDRTSYGQNSLREVHAMGCEFTFHEKGLEASYIFDEKLREKAKRPDTKGAWKKLTLPDRERPAFLTDIENIVHVNGTDTLQVKVSAQFKENNRLRKEYLSDSNFIHLYNFAVAINGRYRYAGQESSVGEEQLEADFQEMSLEYKLSNIRQAKEFAGHLEAAGCFYTDRPVAHRMVESFSRQDLEIIGPLEHLRWLREKEEMGWIHGKEQPRKIREQTRIHSLMLPEGTTADADTARAHYMELPEEERDKDTEPMNSMLKLIEKFDGLRIYRKL